MGITSDAIVGIISTLLGTTLGWGLGFITNSIGRVKVDFEDISTFVTEKKDYAIDNNHNTMLPNYKFTGMVPDFITIKFTAVVLNNKNQFSGINNCKVYLKYSDRDPIDVTNGFMIVDKDMVNEFDSLLNIDAKTAKKARFHQSYLFVGDMKTWGKEYSIYLEYKINGSKKKRSMTVFESNKKTTNYQH